MKLDDFKPNKEKNTAIKVVGLRHSNVKLIRNQKVAVRLLPDNNNPYDEDAIKVVGSEGLVGYVANDKSMTLKNKFYKNFKSASELRKECKFQTNEYYGILDVKGSYGLMKINL